MGRDRFLETFVDAPLTICEARDPNGLSRKARAGTLEGFTGVSAPYDVPGQPGLHIRTDRMSVAVAVEAILDELGRRGVLSGERRGTHA